MSPSDFYDEKSWSKIWKKLDQMGEKRGKNLKQNKRAKGAF